MGFVDSGETKEHSGNCFSSPCGLNNWNKQAIIPAIVKSVRQTDTTSFKMKFKTGQILLYK